MVQDDGDWNPDGTQVDDVDSLEQKFREVLDQFSEEVSDEEPEREEAPAPIKEAEETSVEDMFSQICTHVAF